MSLLDPSVSNFTILWSVENQYDRFESQIKTDERLIGGTYFKQTPLLWTNDVILFDTSNENILHAKKVGVAREKIKIFDSEKNCILIAPTSSEDLIIKDSNENDILKLTNPYSRVAYHTILTTTDREIATMHVTKKRNNEGFMYDVNYFTCDFRIKNKKSDRQLLWGVFLAFLLSNFNLPKLDTDPPPHI